MAYTHGPEICQVCLFSDITFFDENRFGLERYCDAGGELWSICRDLYPRDDVGFVKKMYRRPQGLWPASLGLGFGGHSGCAAVNLALQMGAKCVYLLGCDCKANPRVSKNWHDSYKVTELRPENAAQLFEKFREGWRAVSTDLPVRFPGRRIINLGPDSALDYFPRGDLNKCLSALMTIS